MKGMIRALQRCFLFAGLTVVSAAAVAADATSGFPDMSRAATENCRTFGGILSDLAHDRRQGMPESSAALNFYERNRTVGRVGSHIPNGITKDRAAVLTKFVYSYPKLPEGSFYEIGTFNCEIFRVVPATHPNAADVLPILAINASDCLARDGDVVKDRKTNDPIERFDNDKVDACEGRAAKAIAQELLKPQ